MPWGAAAATVAGAYISSQANKSAASTAADAQRYSADRAAEAQQFRPIGVTTGFGSSQFTQGPYGPESASYTLTPEMQGIRDRLLSQASAYDTTRIGQLTEPLYGAASGLFGLGSKILPTQYNTAQSPEAQALANQYRFAQQGLMPTSFQTGATPEAMAYANRLNQLSGQVTPTSYDPTAAAQQYYQQQQELLQPGRAAEEARLATSNFGRGTGGLGVQTGTGTAPSNPLAQALFNARAQQDRTLAAQSTDIARQRLRDDIGLGTQLDAAGLTTQQQSEAIQRANMLQNLGLSLGYGTQGYATGEAATDLARQRSAADIQLGAGLFGTGAGLLGQVPALTTAGYGPLQTQLGLAGTIESLGQNALDIGAQLGGRTATAGQGVGQSLLKGGLAAAQTQYGANASSPLGSTLTGLGSSIRPGTTNQLGNWFNNLINYGGTPQGAYGQQNAYLSSIPSSSFGGTQQQQQLYNQGGSDWLSYDARNL
jgi:hypothetical protein